MQNIPEPGPSPSPARKQSVLLSNNKPRRKLGSVHETSPVGGTTTTETDTTDGVTTKKTTKVIKKVSNVSDTVTPWGVTLKPVARVSKVSVTEKEMDTSKIKHKGRDMPEFGVELGEIGFSGVDKKPVKKASKVQIVLEEPGTAETIEKKPKETVDVKRKQSEPKKQPPPRKTLSVSEVPRNNANLDKVGRSRKKLRLRSFMM